MDSYNKHYQQLMLNQKYYYILNHFQRQYYQRQHMNINRKIPPTPNSPLCRKPLFPFPSPPSPSHPKKQPSQSLHRPQSTKNTRSRLLIDEQNRQVLKDVHCRKNNSSNSLETTHQSPKKLCCNNHRNRLAMHQLDMNKNQYLCLECSLLYAKKGLKIKIINSMNVNTDRSNRQKQTKEYLSKCKGLQNDLQLKKTKYTELKKQLTQSYTKLILQQTKKMQIQIVNIKTIYLQSINKLENERQSQLLIYQHSLINLQEIYQQLISTSLDIQKNYQDCIQSFTSHQFRSIMDEYWNKITKAQLLLSQNPPTKPIKVPLDLSLSARTTSKSQNNTTLQDFTFSKQKKFDTPPFSKDIRGIKFAESQPDTNRYDSSLKQSIVDSKIILNDFTL